MVDWANVVRGPAYVPAVSSAVVGMHLLQWQAPRYGPDCTGEPFAALSRPATETVQPDTETDAFLLDVDGGVGGGALVQDISKAALWHYTANVSGGGLWGLDSVALLTVKLTPNHTLAFTDASQLVLRPLFVPAHGVLTNEPAAITGIVDAFGPTTAREIVGGVLTSSTPPITTQSDRFPRSNFVQLTPTTQPLARFVELGISPQFRVSPDIVLHISIDVALALDSRATTLSAAEMQLLANLSTRLDELLFDGVAIDCANSEEWVGPPNNFDLDLIYDSADERVALSLYDRLCVARVMSAGDGVFIVDLPFQAVWYDGTYLPKQYAVWFARGVYGQYGFQLTDQISGATAVILVPVQPYVAPHSIEISTQPCPEVNATSGECVPAPDVGLRFEVQPSVRVLAADGSALGGFRVMAMFIPVTHTEFNRSLFWDFHANARQRATAMADITPHDLENFAGTRVSLRSDATSGLATFQRLAFWDAVPGCYRVLFYIAQDPREKAGGEEGWVFALSPPSEPVCVRVATEVRWDTPPPEVFVRGAPLKDNDAPVLSVWLPSFNDTITRNVMYVTWFLVFL